MLKVKKSKTILTKDSWDGVNCLSLSSRVRLVKWYGNGDSTKSLSPDLQLSLLPEHCTNRRYAGYDEKLVRKPQFQD